MPRVGRVSFNENVTAHQGASQRGRVTPIKQVQAEQAVASPHRFGGPTIWLYTDHASCVRLLFWCGVCFLLFSSQLALSLFLLALIFRFFLMLSLPFRFQIHVVSAADTFMPVIVADAMRPDRTPEEEEKEEKEGKVSVWPPFSAAVGCFASVLP